MIHLSLLVLPVLLNAVHGFPDYQTHIPNGNRVPHPCVKGQAWLGVGHTSPAGGGDRNPFGVDFFKHNLVWTSELCRRDSDGDGRTNGEELGDPTCSWRKGRAPTHTTNITHPGICEPTDAAHCRTTNHWLQCQQGHFECDAFKDKDLQNLTLKLPPTRVPPSVTTYTCMLFRVPSDQSYHLVAAQPLLNNTRVVHHMLLFGCRNAEDMSESTEPYQCGMVPHGRCMEVIITWTIGIQGDCIHKEAGFRLGKLGYTMVALQVHWNNPDRASDFMDSSGLVIHVTPNLRQHDAGILIFGHVYLEVDPKSQTEAADDDKVEFSSSGSYMQKTASSQTYTSTCPQHCLREMLPTTIYLTTAINHMHYRGKHQRLELLRNGTEAQDLAWDQTYDYDSPVAHRLDPPVALHPGDEIRTTCTFNRPSSGQPVCYGDGTSDEMCFGFLTYFPLQPMLQPWCTSRRSLISCERTLPQLWDRPIANCSWRSFIRPPSAEALRIIGKVLGACYANERLVCSDACRKVLGEVRQHPCFVGDIGYYVVNKIGSREEGVPFAKAWFTCNCDRKFDYCERKTEHGLLGEDQDTLCAMAGSSTGAATQTCLAGRLVALSLVLCTVVVRSTLLS